ncbi:hypothetical protein GCM10029992_15010 [Glycomyces albus]
MAALASRWRSSHSEPATLAAATTGISAAAAMPSDQARLERIRGSEVRRSSTIQVVAAAKAREAARTYMPPRAVAVSCPDTSR